MYDINRTMREIEKMKKGGMGEIPFYYIPMFAFHGASRFTAVGDIIADMVVPAEE